MRNEKWRRIFGSFIVFLIVAFIASPQFRHVYELPGKMRIMQGETALFNVNYPLTVSVSSNFDQSIHIKENRDGNLFSQPVFLESVQTGQAIVDFKLLGLIPLKQVAVDILPPIKLVAGGQSIGVVLQVDGVLVVGSSSIVNSQGKLVNPAQKAGIQTGDVILTMNGQNVTKDIEVAAIIDQSGKLGQNLQILLRRDQTEIMTTLEPVLCSDTKRYRIGLFVRDSAIGVGTLTFFDPSTYRYGALGHIITDGDTNQAIPCRTGKIVPSLVSSIHFGKAGQPGEKVGNFIEESDELGNIEKNTKFGIYGKIAKKMCSLFNEAPLEIASMDQIEEGAAEILTVVDGQTVEKFAISIERIHWQDYPDSKGLVLKVTDERLLAKTGGIIQGMSGSPIIQKGKLVGAVTHVFVHDPTKGYGCFMDWMLMESGIIPKSAHKVLPQLFM